MYPRIVVSSLGASYLKQGQLWMYRNNLVSFDPDVQDGAIVSIYDTDDNYIATGFYSTISHIVCRIISSNEKEVIDDDFFYQRLYQAYKLRKEFLPDLNNCRLVYGEGDGLDGLVIDKYADVLVSQISCKAIELRKDMLYASIIDILKKEGIDIKGIYERNEIASRIKEGLTSYKGFYQDVDLPTTCWIKENGIFIQVDFVNGQKTGYFLDQKFNRLLIKDLAKGKNVLDAFCHTAAFGLNAALGQAKSVVSVDISPLAIKQAKINAQKNKLTNKMQFVVADVFDYLEKINKGDFDLVILDPPAFTKSKDTLMKAYNGYLNINSQAMMKLNKGGYLASCSCSRYLSDDLFQQMIQESSEKAQVNYEVISFTHQSLDHPINSKLEKTSYLKFMIIRLGDKYD